MSRADRWTCSHCGAEIFIFSAAVEAEFIVLLAKTPCAACGQRGGILVMDAEATPNCVQSKPQQP